MTQRHYFVVEATVDEFGTVSWLIDDETAMARFPEGAIWDEDSQEWVDTATGAMPEYATTPSGEVTSKDFLAHEDLRTRLNIR